MRSETLIKNVKLILQQPIIAFVRRKNQASVNLTQHRLMLCYSLALKVMRRLKERGVARSFVPKGACRRFFEQSVGICNFYVLGIDHLT